MNIYEQILAKLRTKFPGADDATLQRIASKKSDGVTDEGKVDSIVEGISLVDVMNNYGDYRADGAQKTAVANYEKKHGIKDGKPISEPKPETQPSPAQQTQTETPPAPPQEREPSQALTAQDIARLVTEGVNNALKPFGERLDRMDAEKAKAEFDAKVEGVAKSFGIPTFAYRGKTIPSDADLNQYFTDLKQEMQNEGYQFAPPPQAGAPQDHADDGRQIAGLINEGTEQLNKENK